MKHHTLSYVILFVLKATVSGSNSYSSLLRFSWNNFGGGGVGRSQGYPGVPDSREEPKILPGSDLSYIQVCSYMVFSNELA